MRPTVPTFQLRPAGKMRWEVRIARGPGHEANTRHTHSHLTWSAAAAAIWEAFLKMAMHGWSGASGISKDKEKERWCSWQKRAAQARRLKTEVLGG